MFHLKTAALFSHSRIEFVKKKLNSSRISKVLYFRRSVNNIAALKMFFLTNVGNENLFQNLIRAETVYIFRKLKSIAFESYFSYLNNLLNLKLNYTVLKRKVLFQFSIILEVMLIQRESSSNTFGRLSRNKKLFLH